MSLRNDLLNSFLEALGEESDELPESVSETTRIKDELNLSSLIALSVFSQLEEKYEVDFPYDDLNQLETVGQALDVFEQLLSEKA